MKLTDITAWLDRELDVAAFDDVSNNGLQIARAGDEVSTVAFAVDASLASVKEAAEAGAQLLVVHHGISWGGGMKRLTGGVYAVVKAAMEANLAVYAVHLPLDASEKYGNNWEIARYLKLTDIRPAFSYHGRAIGVIGTRGGHTFGICSGGGGEFAAEAQALGCELFITGEADWGETIAAENVGMPMVCCGHYETETFGVKALCRAVSATFGLKGVFIGRGAA